MLLGLSALAVSGAAWASQTLAVDTKTSELKWEGKKIAGPHFGTIGLKSGSLVWDKDTITGGKFEIDMNTITVSKEDIKDPETSMKLVNHLKDKDFFAVQENPTANFEITKVETTGPGMAKVTGNLTIRGKTNEVSFPAKIENKGGTVSAEGTVVVDRTKYGVQYASAKFFDVKKLADKVIDDNFSLSVKLMAKAGDTMPAKKAKSK